MVVLHRVLAALSLCFLFMGATARHHLPDSPSPEALYSRRALRRTRLIIELRLLEFRKERLECVRRAILRNLPPDLRPRDGGHRTLPHETCTELLR
jgi:hypothetical protein